MAKGLLLKGDKDLELVLLCSNKPTITLLKQVAENLTAQLEVELSTYSCFTSFKIFHRFRIRLFLYEECLCAFLMFCSSFSTVKFRGDIYSKPVSRGCSRCCDEHQGVDPDSHYPPDITSRQDGAGE